MQDMGNVIAIDDQNITTMQGRHEFRLPRICVDDFNKSEAFLLSQKKMRKDTKHYRLQELGQKKLVDEMYCNVWLVGVPLLHNLVKY